MTSTDCNDANKFAYTNTRQPATTNKQIIELQNYLIVRSRKSIQTLLKYALANIYPTENEIFDLHFRFSRFLPYFPRIWLATRSHYFNSLQEIHFWTSLPQFIVQLSWFPVAWIREYTWRNKIRTKGKKTKFKFKKLNVFFYLVQSIRCDFIRAMYNVTLNI